MDNLLRGKRFFCREWAFQDWIFTFLSHFVKICFFRIFVEFMQTFGRC